MAENRDKTDENTSTKSFDDIYGKIIEEAIWGDPITGKRRGFLFSYSLNHYEKTSREVLLQHISEDVLKCADIVLAHFGTSVGANRNILNPDLWCIQRCDECGTNVDTRKFNSIPHYSMLLCETCIHKRNSERKCSKCSSPVDDPADEREYDPEQHWPSVKKQFTGKTKSGEYKYEYICSWCIMGLGYWRGFDSFIGRRIPRAEDDRRILLAQLRTKENIEDAPGVRRLEMGEKYGSKWADYCVESYGLDFGVHDNADEYPYYRIQHKDSKRVIYLARQRIFYKYSFAYLEIRFLPRFPYGVTEVEVKDEVRIQTQKEREKIRTGRFFGRLKSDGERVEGNGGRPSGSGYVNEDNKRDALNLVIRTGRKIYSSNGESSKHRVAVACSSIWPSPSYGISAAGQKCYNKCAGCQAIDRLIKTYNPNWTWRDDILPRIKAPTYKLPS